MKRHWPRWDSNPRIRRHPSPCRGKETRRTNLEPSTSTSKTFTVADWRQFREYPLPCVGLTEIAEGVKPRDHYCPETRLAHPTLHRAVLVSNIKRAASGNTQYQRQSVIAANQHHGYDRGENTSKCQGILTSPDSVCLTACDPQASEITSSDSERESHLTGNSGGSDLNHSCRLQQTYSLTASSPHLCDSSTMSGPSYTPPLSPMCGRVLSSPLSPSHLPGHLGSSASLFTISPHDAAQLVRMVKTQDSSEPRHCYFIHLKLRTLFSEDSIPGTCIRKLPRLLNGIPLGAGFLSRDQMSEIRWRLVEGEHSTLTFLSCPLLQDEAEECRTSFRDRLITQAQAVFGDITVRASLSLSKCLDYHDSLVLNDIATNVGDGLQFKD